MDAVDKVRFFISLDYNYKSKTVGILRDQQRAHLKRLLVEVCDKLDWPYCVFDRPSKQRCFYCNNDNPDVRLGTPIGGRFFHLACFKRAISPIRVFLLRLRILWKLSASYNYNNLFDDIYLDSKIEAVDGKIRAHKVGHI